MIRMCTGDGPQGGPSPRTGIDLGCFVPYQYAAPVLGNIDVIAVADTSMSCARTQAARKNSSAILIAVQQEVPRHGHDYLVAVSVLGQVQRHGT